jgi:Peptidoglycan-binding protein, CsiV
VKRLFLIITLVFAPITLLHAATPVNNVYEVEVIVFENRMPDLEGGELWRNVPDKSADSDIAEAINAGEPAPADSSLAAAADALEKSGRHHVLAHLRWQQTAEAKSVSKPVKIANADGGLDGALRFYLSRYLLVDLNLLLRETASGGIFGGAAAEPPVYRLSEYRRVKLLETHYFDHPKFGALVRVSPVKAN